MADAAAAVSGFTLPEGMTMTAAAAEPLVANPVAFCLDEQGRIYVCETFRQSRGVEDNRGHGNWLETDLSLTTVAERVAMFRKFLGDKAAAYTEHEDRVRLLADSDGDGVAEQREALHDGYGVRVAFRGHDMHGLALGPDGRVYFSIGDRGYNVLTPEGSRLVRPETGAVFRCERDGSGLEEFAYGLRNPQELAFDDFGNLFTGDNNSDSGDQARWVHVVEGGDAGWRMHYQYLPDRGPWNRERIWYPYRADEKTTAVQPAAIVPPVANLGNGPSGLAAYPGVGLPQQYDGYFFLVDFRGSKANSGIRSFTVKPKGASFELADSDWFIKGVLATDVDFGYDGRVYLSDWIEGWGGTGKGRIYAGAMPEAVAAAEVATLFREGFAERSPAELERLLAHADRRVRQRAQCALAEQNQAGLFEQVAADTRLAEALRLEAIEELRLWDSPPALDRVTNRHRPLTERPAADAAAAVAAHFAGMLEGPDAVREQAAALLATHEVAAAVPALLTVIDNAEQPAAVRAAVVTAVGRLRLAAVSQRMRTLLRDPAPAVRSAARGLLGRIDPALAVVELEAVLNDGDVGEQQAAIESLVALKTAAADAVLQAALLGQADGTGPLAIRLDLLQAAAARKTPALLEAVASLEVARDPSDSLAAWRECLAGGDVAAGRKIFHENTTASCLRCHQVNGKGGEVGPNLSEIGKLKPTEYLLESIVDPNAAIAKGFATVQFLLADGTTTAGIHSV